MGNAAWTCISRQPLALFAPLFLQWSQIIITIKTPKHQTSLSWCTGWSITAYGCSKSRVHAAAAEAGGQNLQVSSSAALESHIRAELETCRLWPPALGACKKYTHFWPQITPSGKLLSIRAVMLDIKSRLWPAIGSPCKYTKQSATKQSSRGPEALSTG